MVTNQHTVIVIIVMVIIWAAYIPTIGTSAQRATGPTAVGAPQCYIALHYHNVTLHCIATMLHKSHCFALPCIALHFTKHHNVTQLTLHCITYSIQSNLHCRAFHKATLPSKCCLFTVSVQYILQLGIAFISRYWETVAALHCKSIEGIKLLRCIPFITTFAVLSKTRCLTFFPTSGLDKM